MMAVKQGLIAGMVLLSFWQAGPVLADDDVLLAVDEGKQHYQAGRLGEAAAQWEYAATLARQQKGERIGKLFPQPLAGWTLADEQTSAGAAGILTGTMVTRTYRHNDSGDEVTMGLYSDNAMMQTFVMMMVNPSMAAMTGMKVIRVGQRKGLSKTGQGRYEISMPLKNNQMMLKVDSVSTAKAEANATAYLEQMPFDQLEAL